MLLKGCLARTHSQQQLLKLRHNLKRIWRVFKAGANDPMLDEFDVTIAQLDKWEDIRYPDPLHGMLASIHYGQLPPQQWRGVGGERQYRLSATEVDQLVKAIFDHCPLNPMFFQARFRTQAAREFFLMYNDHPIWNYP